MLKLKLQYFGHLMRRVDSLEKTLVLGGIGGRIVSNTTLEPQLENTHETPQSSRVRKRWAMR